MIEEYNLDLLPPAEMTIDIVGASIEGGRALSGTTQAIDISGGGLVTCEYAGVLVQSRAQHRYYQRLRNILAGGTRSIIVPLLTDYVAPLLTPDGPLWRTGIPFGDGSMFSDGSGFRQPMVSAVMAAAAPIGAGTVQVTVLEGAALEGGETFSLFHPTRLHRAYGISEIDDVTVHGGAATYTVAIRPTLREAIAGGEAAEFIRPRCLMRLAPGASLPWKVTNYWWSSPTLSLIESF